MSIHRAAFMIFMTIHRTTAAESAAQAMTNQCGYCASESSMPHVSGACGRCKMNCPRSAPGSNSAQVDPPNVNSKPQLLAWLLCDAVHIDPGSGKHTLLGVFSNIVAKRFPVTHPRMTWFMALTDVAAGPHVMRISMGLDPTDPKPLIERPFESQGPLNRINLISEIHNLSFQQPGEYSILIEIDDEPLLATSLTVAG